MSLVNTRPILVSIGQTLISTMRQLFACEVPNRERERERAQEGIEPPNLCPYP